MHHWRYARMLPRSIIYRSALILMIIASKLNCQLAIPTPGIINVPPLADSVRKVNGGGGGGGGSGGIGHHGLGSTNIASGDVADEPMSGQVINLTRQHDGDVFRTNGMSTCNMDTCVGLSSGTAGLFVAGNDKNDLRLDKNKDPQGTCDCRCLPYLQTYREDLEICVDDIHECTLSPFVSGSSSEKIPFVFLPLRGQIIYPSREISFSDIRTPVCAVTGAQYLTKTGWADLRNPIDTDYPFRMFRDEGRTFLQWLGESDLRQKMQGRLIVVHIMCRDMTISKNGTKDLGNPPKNVFSPCVAFRVNGSPVKYSHNVSEVLFQSEATSTLASTSDGMSTKEYIVIGVCSLLLGLIYVSSVFLYLHMKKRKTQAQELRSSLNDLANEINYPKNDQVTFGAPFHRNGSVYSAASLSPEHRLNGGHIKEEMGIVKNNPLLQHFPNLSDHHSGFTSDISNSNSECEDVHDKIKQMQASVHVHNNGAGGSNGNDTVDSGIDPSASPTQENECLPEENVSITEDMMNDEKMENMKAIVNGTIRKKLYFNPAYFEPHLLQSPPPAAIEFLTKIREVIAIAKYKMATKRYQPSLIMIPEEFPLRTPSQTGSSHVHYSGTYGSSTECQGCATNRCSGHVKNCGDKRNSIEKWLETVPHSDNEDTKRPSPVGRSSPGDRSSPADRSSPGDRPTPNERPTPGDRPKNRKTSPPKVLSAPKQRPPPPPVSANGTPKIISHSLKPNVNTVAISINSTSPPPTPTTPSATITITKKNNDNIYAFAETGGEIYNNPKFSLQDSPPPSQKSRNSPNRSKTPTKVTDQYAPPSDRKHYEMLRNMKRMPDMVYEALAKDYSRGSFSKTNGYNLDIPTPDYDSTMEKKIKDIYNSTQSTVPSVPTPDYSTLSKKSLRQCQPDSPVYRRRSPQYLIVDYETDSLERLDTKRKSSNSSSSPSSDVSSQLSPSLSTALPLEEEVEIRHTIYDKIDGFRKDGDSNIKKKVAKPILPPTQKEIAARIKYDTPFRGSMTIEVEHEPQSDLELSTDSDQFEPDTLDRKMKKHSFCDVNAWSEHLNKSRNFVNSLDGKVSYSSLENMTTLTDIESSEHRTNNYILRSSNSFRVSAETPKILTETPKTPTPEEVPRKSTLEARPSFGSLREIYQSKVIGSNNNRPKLTNISFTDQGRILTLEAKHCRRQRVIPLEDKCAMPPDIIPDGTNNNEQQTDSYEENQSKNPKGWNTNNFSGTNIKKPLPPPKYVNGDASFHDKNNNNNNNCNNNNNNDDDNDDNQDDEQESTSNHSESTEVTGVSDTQANNSEVEDYKSSERKKPTNATTMSQNTKKKQKSKLNQEQEYSAMYESKLNGVRTDYSLNKYLNRKKSHIGESEDVEEESDHRTEGAKSPDDPNKVEILSISSLSSRLSDRTKEMYRNAGVPVGIAYPQRNGTNVQTVYRCEVPPISNGMQIAMGLKDRAKKTKDLKNAWKKFVSMAASKFSPTSSLSQIDKTAAFLESTDKDDGISSLIDDHTKVGSVKSSSSAPQSYSNYYEQRYGHKLTDLDSGYMSADSSDVYNRRFYDRYNFKMLSGRDRVIRVDTIEDNSDTHSSDGNAGISDNNPTLERVRSSDNNDDREKDDGDDSDRTLTRSIGRRSSRKMVPISVYSSDDEDRSQSRASYISQTETEEEGEPYADDACESGAESVETHSILKLKRKCDIFPLSRPEVQS
ncbi:uncharacterized protein LOC129952276 [Eupeodes corollae]|uniref:uncharacterized protein LOC129952276 n=1 Tax=Eupeodes corollae TaxID=290404 RepID=UPI00249213B0|nr:uncharacterized protein LOC129952276 [Eupeodes corollae]